ncbi:DUF2510 domain-containing protein [Sphaerisporangium sp. TRM90804]|uniref:DUF2510 domain-containing protein n=1 Tax=Sphaerisporangium sp. TRM90804 TaxID=3031113 RepID=UPI002446E13F|nr:DUF2510 domain-containing protein [Sphaerisporangium sp. TRM90804]MDH2428439.1 DUF2510 domain-containing protein [Sphaerisporangium sp. TRM90804]
MNTPQQPRPGVPLRPGFYPDPGGRPCLRWWDGGDWTPTTAPLPPQAPLPAVPQPSKGAARKWLAIVGVVLALAALGWLVPTAVALLGDANPVVLAMPTGEEVKRNDVAQILDELATYVDVKAGAANSTERWTFCDAIPDAFLKAGIQVRYPSGEGAFVGACVDARSE